ncbi:hypothetical protein pdam_00021207 [Pocillopora damicornis]|uniref:ZP domain-containing protein n=1 Tax=Pocillopora damicornis TaxID=46731 RepID=A0A3M6USX1_POCDA|nr:hypothetical protein pdam_00021207 [Pocillopora damicornis]
MNASLKSPVKIMPSVITSLAVIAVAAPVGTPDATAILISMNAQNKMADALTADDVDIKCFKNYMSITLPKTLLLGLSREHVTLRDLNCVATETNTHYTLTTAFTDCGTTATFRKGAVVYSNTVLEIPVEGDAVVTRVREIEIPFSCYFKSSGDAISVGYKPDIRKLVVDEDGKGNFSLNLDMFADEKFTLPYREEDYPVQIKQKQDLCFRASVKSEDKNLSVLVENCFATSSKNTYLAAKYYLVKNGCCVDKTTKFVPTPKTEESRFSIEGFKFIADHPFVFLHCQMRICDSDDLNSRCSQGCLKGSREKRDANNEDKLYSLVQGPLTIDDDVEETKANQKTVKDATIPAVLPLLVLAVICIVGMIWLDHKRKRVARVYTP